ncbi:AAA domain-containing protein, putative AbiEii toxin, Type IV TA system [Loktanella salsilacus]|uniref:AAA domain-containing protein, putative AbiEii toxin, Type IV TA system n=1 Tax=Loktanella salsilacus TaxID=195913 RepID=A0A1I4JFT8_9RHOB|nr:AAA family ATPase [Loktanella salsilacus]SFL65445.1 AAA domain-containing protein, putative AbiEii toxin, Type IV TA system [Loktanella salsilacus]
MPRIRRIQIKNFRSIKNLDLEVDDLAIFVGDNDSGKSNILRALNLFFNDRIEGTEPLDFERDYNKFALTNQRAREIEVTLTFELPENYHARNGERAIWRKKWRSEGLRELRDWAGVRESQNRRGRTKWTENKFTSRSKVPALLSRVEFEYIPAIRGKDYLRSLRGRIFKVISEVSEQSFRDSSTNFEDAIGENVEALILDISEEIQDNALLKLPNDLSQIFETLDFLSGEQNISLEQRGDGVKGRYVPLILKFIADKKSSLLERGGTPYTFIWAYEEPENNLEMRRAQETAELFERLAAGNTTQILLTTHSPIFFNAAGSEELSVSTVFVSKPDDETGSLGQTMTPSISDLDSRMGVMAIVAPHMAEAMASLQAVDQQRADLQQAINDLTANTRMIYVEGQSDNIVFSALINAMNISTDTPVVVAAPPQRAGANYVANMLRAWEYKTKHLDTERFRAIGFVDCDSEGERALKQFSDEMKRHKFVKLFPLPFSQTVTEAHNLGIQFSNCLEELFPNEWWVHAFDQDWLGERDIDGILSHSALIEIANQRTTRDNLYLGRAWELHARYHILDAHKIQFANWVASLESEILLGGLSVLSEMLREELGRIGVQFIAPPL